MDWINWDVIVPTGHKNTRYGPARDASGACTSVCYIVTNGLNVHPISLQQRMTEAIPITSNDQQLNIAVSNCIENNRKRLEIQRLLRQHAFIFCSSTCDPDNVWRTLFSDSQECITTNKLKRWSKLWFRGEHPPSRHHVCHGRLFRAVLLYGRWRFKLSAYLPYSCTYSMPPRKRPERGRIPSCFRRWPLYL